VRSTRAGVPSHPRIFYGWYVLAASFALLFVNAGAIFIFGLLVKPMQTEFGWSRGAVSSASFLNMAVYALAILVTGKLYDRWGPKWVITGSALLVGLGFGLMATVHSLWAFLLWYGVVAAAGFGGTSTPLFGSLMGRWFEKRRGLAVSLALAGTPLGQFVLLPVVSNAITVSGWRTVSLWIAGVTILCNLALTFAIIRGDPDQLGLRPYGSDDGPRPQDTDSERPLVTPESPAPPALPEDLSLQEAMRTRSLWLFTLTMFICGAGDFLVLNHLVAMVTDHGLAEAVGASMLAWCGLLGLAGILLAGPALDRWGNRRPVALTFALRIVLFALLLTKKDTVLFWVYALGMGFTLPITAPVLPTLVGKLYGLRHLGFICGSITLVHMLGGGVWSFLAGVIFDHTGNYDLALLISAIASAVALVCMLLVREERHLLPASDRVRAHVKEPPAA
jgi:MFS family permease